MPHADAEVGKPRSLPQTVTQRERRVDTGTMLDTGEGFGLSHTLYHIAIIWPNLATPETGLIKVQSLEKGVQRACRGRCRDT
jgi:hypothetical protein